MDNSIYAQLNLFRLIAAEGSITAAARRLGITTPSASAVTANGRSPHFLSG